MEKVGLDVRASSTNRPFRPFSRRTLAVRVRSDARKLAIRHDLVFLANGVPSKIVLKNLADSRSISRLGGKGSPGDVWRHGLPWHRPPGVILWGWLRKPHVASIATKAPVFQGPHNGVRVAQLPTRRVNEKCSSSHSID